MTLNTIASRGQTRPRRFYNLFPLRLTRKGRNSLAAYAFLLPGMAFILMWLAYPMVNALRISLYDWQLMPGATSPFLGLGNYRAALADPIFWSSLANTTRYALVTVAGQLFFGLVVALALEGVRHARVAMRVLYYLPVVTSWVVVSLLFEYLFNSNPAGLVNQALVNTFHLVDKAIPWLNEPRTAFIALYALGIWKGVGWTMVIFLAALQALPEECFAAAAIDGADGKHMLIYITLPLLAPTIALVFVMLTIGAFQTYIPIALITGGGPIHRTDVMLSYMYSQAFTDLKFGYSAALSFILAGIVFAISQAQLRLTRREAHSLP